MENSNIHDVILEHKLIPMPFKPWNEYLERVKLQAIALKTTGRNLMMKPGYGPTLDELPTHFVLKEGARISKEHRWPQAGQDLDVVCSGENACYIFINRGYLCKRHNPTTSDLQSVDN